MNFEQTVPTGISVKGFAKALGVSRATVIRMLKREEVESVLVSRRRRVIPTSEISRILKGRPKAA